MPNTDQGYPCAGTIEEWHPHLARGTIKDGRTGKTYLANSAGNRGYACEAGKTLVGVRVRFRIKAPYQPVEWISEPNLVAARSTILLRYPFFGKVVRCIGGTATLQSNEGDFTVDVGSRFGRALRDLDWLAGKNCAFSIGGSPARYSQGRSLESTAVQWALLDDIEERMTRTTYTEARRAQMAALSRAGLADLLAAEWYVAAWEEEAGARPKVLLSTDDLLDHTVNHALSSCQNVEELIFLLGTIFTSPYYAIDDASREKACKRFFQPAEWALRVFLPNRPAEECRLYGEVWPLCGTAIRVNMNRARTVAIDLEAEGGRIWEYGWKNAVGSGIKSGHNDLTDADLRAAVQESMLSLHTPCIVGHNLLNWDLPRLQERHVSFPEQCELWDTLIAAWIMEPWELSHALIVEKDAHRADADAGEAYEAFERQIARLTPCLKGDSRDIHDLVNQLFEGTTKLSDVRKRRYPARLKGKFAQILLYPRNRAAEVAWHRACRVEFMSPEDRLADTPLDATICHRIAVERGDIYSKVAAVVVADAESDEVDVRLSMLPAWLVANGLRAVLRDAHAGQHEGDRTPAHRVYFAEDVFKQPAEEWSAWLHDQDVSVEYRDEVLRVWQTACSRDLSEEEVRTEFPGAVEGRTGRALLPVKDRNGKPSWLLYEPPGHGADRPAWRCIPVVSDCLMIDRPTTDAGPVPAELAAMPRWKDGGATSLDLDRMFVTPDTANRALYLADVLHCILNVLRALPENQVLICAMRWQSEANLMQQHLTQLSLSVLHAESPLRQLGRLSKEGLRVLVCTHSSLAAYLDAAGQLRQHIAIAVDEAPLHRWYALLNDPQGPEPSVAPDTESRSSEEQDEQTEVQEEAESAQPTDRFCHVVFKGKDIQTIVSLFMAGWLKGLLKTDEAPARPILVLDPRLCNHPLARTVGVQREDLPFYSVDEILDEHQRAVYYEACFPKRPDAEIPNDYQTYRLFLEKNWQYADFWPGTQRPAIEALIKGHRDLLLRLPTGAGKSEVFQVPALLRSSYSRRLTVVITPLRALMQDQVLRLWQRHFHESVDYLSGGRDAWLNHEAYQGVLDGRVQLLYVAPERFRVPRFTEVLERRRRMDGGLEFVVIDEAHCVSEWGFEFRPDYLYAARYVAEWFKEKDLPGNPHRLILASATVTRRNQKDLENELRLPPRGEYDDLPVDMPHPIQPFIVLESCDLPESEEVTADPKFEKIVELLAQLDLTRSAALVFVRKRADCHRLSEALNAQAAVPDSAVGKLHALPFHAGLPETVKTEACDLLRNRAANVLVCTKAFGMGMDIPHLHACIHYRPPTFVEDYLQEVGRVGRSRKERDAAGNPQVTATLLYNNGNLEDNLGLLHDKAVKAPDLQVFLRHCNAHAVSFPGINKAVCILPARVRISETKEFDENQVVNCLFWLERMGVLAVEGRHPPFLDLTLKLTALRKIAKGAGPLSPLAGALLGIVHDTKSAVSAPPERAAAGADPSEAGFARFIRGLVRGFFALLSSAAAPDTPLAAGSTQPARMIVKADDLRASVSVTELMAASGGIDADELFSGLFDMSRSGAVSVGKTFAVVKHTAQSGEEIWALLKHAVKRLLRPTAGTETLSRKALEQQLAGGYQKFLARKAPAEAPDQALTEGAMRRRVKREVYRATGAALRIVRYAGLPVTEGISTDGTTQYVRAVSKTSASLVRRGAAERVEAVRKLVDFLRNREPHAGAGATGSFEVNLTDVMELFGAEVRMSRLKEICKLVEVTGFYGFDSSSDDWVSIVSLNGTADLPEPVADPSSPRDQIAAAPTTDPGRRIQEVYVEMATKHELQVLRAQCMVLLAAMPTEGRRQFIDRYFQCMTADDIKKALEDTVGEVGEELLAGNEMLRNLLAQVRKERFVAEMGRLNDAQREVCAAPAVRKLLVNAGPGSGKTHVLMMRCAHLIHVGHIRPSEILVLAFNRAVVFEIRDRIRDLFSELGYGSYVRGLNVVTFHSFALRELEMARLFEEDAIGEAVHRFADRISHDPSFAKLIAGRYSAILVDEFQDMNEDFYAVVQALATHCQGGTMVIGDDDQDILTWNRRAWMQTVWGRAWHAEHHEDCPLEAVSYFRKFEESFQPDKHTLTSNYRSARKIVTKINAMIARASECIGFERMKAGTELVAVRTEPGQVEHPFDTQRLAAIVADALDRGNDTNGNAPVAVLCRTNRQCRQVYESLREHLEPARLQVLGSEDFPLYQLRPTGAMKDLCLQREQWEFVETYAWEDLLSQYRTFGHADMQEGAKHLNVIYELVRAEKGRPRIRDVIDFIQEIRASDVERLRTKAGVGPLQPRVVISTVHKVKGLQYSTVIVMPSADRFPLTAIDAQQPTVGDSAEEARLCYVAMTRARDRLYIGLDWNPQGREYQWWHRQPFEPVGAAAAPTLKGSPKEVVVRWSGRAANVDNDVQEYIARHVDVGDSISLLHRDMYHNATQIGVLTDLPPDSADLRVANVIRYSCGNYFREHNRGYWDELHPSVQQRSWFYVVLVETC